MPNPIQIIKEDHEIIRNLFTTYNGYTENDDEQKKETAHEILKELSIHAKMEEKFFYPKLKEAIDAGHPIPVDDAIAEHHAAKVLMLELKVMPVTSETYDAKMNVLEENVTHHMEEEETELLPHAEMMLAGEMEEIGTQMEDYRRSAHKDILEKLLGE
jgi:hypothetical protein